MLSRLRARITYANVVATLALFIALGGTAWAVAANSVGTAQLKNDAVVSSKVKDNTITGADVNEGTLGAVGFAFKAGNAFKLGGNGPSAFLAANGKAVDAAHADNAANATHAGSADSATNAGNATTADALGPPAPWQEVVETNSGSGCDAPGRFCWYFSYSEWVNRPNGTGEDFNSVGYYRDRTGIVRLKGLARCVELISGGCGGQHSVFILPPGDRPEHTMLFSTFAGNATEVRLRIPSSGEVTIDIGSAAEDFVSLDAVSFRCGPSGSNGCP